MSRRPGASGARVAGRFSHWKICYAAPDAVDSPRKSQTQLFDRELKARPNYALHTVILRANLDSRRLSCVHFLVKTINNLLPWPG